MNCIENDENCIVNAKSINSDIYVAILSNGMKIKLIFNEDDAGYDQTCSVVINDGEYIQITIPQFQEIISKIETFLKNTWGWCGYDDDDD